MQKTNLEQQIKEIAELGKEDKNIDIASLMMNALQKEDKNFVSSKQKKWAYLISVAIPPFGLLFALKYYFSSEDDAKQVAMFCTILTLASFFMSWILFKSLLVSSGTNLNEMQTIKPEDVLQLLK